MELDKEVIDETLEHLRQTTQDIKAMRVDSPRAFKENTERFRAIKNALYEGVMDLIAIGQHIIATLQFEKPRAYRDIFRILKENKVIPEELYGRIEKAGGFRIMLAHEYRNVNPEKIYELHLRTKDFEDFILAIEQFLESQSFKI